MSGQKINRRQMIKGTAIGVAGLAAASITRPTLGALGANERIRVGVIGPGDRATDLMNEFFREGKRYNAELVAICDLWSLRREQARQFVKDHSGMEPAVFRNTEELYAARAVDAVLIGTPDFSHAILCAEAVRAGLDVYVEKPLADVIEDARLVRQACLESDRIVRMGTNGRSAGKQMAAARFVREGKFGKVIAAELGYHVNQPKRWRREKLVSLLKEKDTDWRRYQLNRPPQPFDARKYLEFRLFWPYSSGLPDQWLSHQMDTVAHVTGELFPASCVASGQICQWHDGRENPDTFAAIFEYASGFQVRYSARHTNSYGDLFQRFFCNQGTLDIESGTVSPAGGIGRKEGGTADLLAEQKLPAEPSVSHVGNWLDCIRTRKQPIADITAGYAHAVAVSMAVRAMHTGKRVTFNPAKGEIMEE
jgi:predicted dehydrogenase